MLIPLLGQSCQINVYLNREAKSTNALQVHFNMSVFEVCSKLAEQVMPDQVKPFLSLKKVLVHPQDPSIVECTSSSPPKPWPSSSACTRNAPCTVCTWLPVGALLSPLPRS